MQTKVEICGVNTSGLPVLSAKKTDELFEEMQKNKIFCVFFIDTYLKI